MPAVTVENPLVPPASPVPTPPRRWPARRGGRCRAPRRRGAGFEVLRPFPVASACTRPTRSSSWISSVPSSTSRTRPRARVHPHRGFETVTYVLDGEIAHHDPTVVARPSAKANTQWMTAGAAHPARRCPDRARVARGRTVARVQLWVNLPSSLKSRRRGIRHSPATGSCPVVRTTAARSCVSSPAISPDTADRATRTRRITYAHATISPGAQLTVPWDTQRLQRDGLVLLGQGDAGAHGVVLCRTTTVVVGNGGVGRKKDLGDTLSACAAADHQEGPTVALEVRPPLVRRVPDR